MSAPTSPEPTPEPDAVPVETADDSFTIEESKALDFDDTPPASSDDDS